MAVVLRPGHRRNRARRRASMGAGPARLGRSRRVDFLATPHDGLEGAQPRACDCASGDGWPTPGHGRARSRSARRCARAPSGAGWVRSARGTGAAGEESADAHPADELKRALRCAQTNARSRSRVVHELALRPESSIQARMPPTARSAPRGVWRGLLILTAGLGAVVLPALHHRSGGRVPISLRTRGVSPIPCVRTEQRAQKPMTRTEQNLAARRRGEFNRDRIVHHVSSTIDARRRLNDRQADATGPKQARSVQAIPATDT
jgi:hypothetical protein